MEHSASALETVGQESLQRQLTFFKSAVEDAVYELWRGELNFRESEMLAREVTIVRSQIAEIERKLRSFSSAFSTPPEVESFRPMGEPGAAVREAPDR